jgi:hypothetical protein
MEGYGLQFTAEALRLDGLVVRGTSDYCNARKNNQWEKQWQRYAANIAAAYVRTLIEQLPRTPPPALLEFASLVRRISIDGSIEEILPEAVPLLTAALQSRPPLGAAQLSTSNTSVARILDPQTISSDIDRRLERMEQAQLQFDLTSAFKEADAIENILQADGQTLPKSQLRTAYFRLAALAGVRTEFASQSGAPCDYSHAERLIRLARQ